MVRFFIHQVVKITCFLSVDLIDPPNDELLSRVNAQGDVIWTVNLSTQAQAIDPTMKDQVQATRIYHGHRLLWVALWSHGSYSVSRARTTSNKKQSGKIVFAGFDPKSGALKDHLIPKL